MNYQSVRVVFALAFLGILAGTSPPAIAQEQSGSIQGVVKDATGGVLPGVMVEARSAQTVGVSSTTTDAAGVYRFPALPPGQYQVSASLQGFSPAKSAAILSLGQHLRVELTLALPGLSETVQVTGETPLIDVKANAATANLTSIFIDLIPKGRNFTSVLTQIPGTNNESRGGGIMIDGSSGSENRYIVDGLDTTSARTGQSQKDVITDFIETIQVKQSGYNAEYRAALGGVISAVTKSGSNQFHGNVGSYYSNNSFLGKVRQSLRQIPTNQAKAEYITTPRDKGYSVDPVFSIQGPIKKDKIWFFVGYNPSYSYSQRTVTWVTPKTFAPTQTFDNNSPYDRTLNYNATSQIFNSLRARFTGSNERTRGSLGMPGIEPDGTSTSNASSYNPRPALRSDTFTDSYTGIFDWVASGKLYVNVTAGYFGYGSHSAGGDYYHGTRRTFSQSNVGLLDVPASLQQLSGYAENTSNNYSLGDNYSRTQVSADATWFGRLLGDHAVKVGGLYENIGNKADFGDQAPNISFAWGTTYNTLSNTTAKGPYGYFTVSQQFTKGSIHEVNLSFFAQDQWTVSNNLTVNYGVRLEHEQIPSYRPENPGVTFGWGDKIAPRLGFAYDLKGDGRWKTYGSWGLFYDTMKLEMPRGAWGAERWVQYIYTLDTYNWNTIDCTGTPDKGCAGGTFIELNDRRHVSNQLGASLVDPNLKPTRTGEFTLGVDHEFSPVMSLGARYAHKWMDQTIDDVGVIVVGVGEVFYIANPGYGIGTGALGPNFPATPKVNRAYDSFELVLRKRLSHNWQATTSVVFSRLFGNYGGLASSDENGRASPNVSRYYDGLYMSFDQKGNQVKGLLQTDRPIQFKFQAAYITPWGTSVGMNFLATSGQLQTSQVTYQTVPVYFLGRGDLGRSPVFNQTDLHVAHDFRLPGRTRLSLQADIMNLFDQSIWLTEGTSAYRDSLTIPGFTGNPGGAFFQPGGFDTVAIQSAANAANSSSGRPQPMYKMPNGYQNARSIRMAIRFTF